MIGRVVSRPRTGAPMTSSFPEVRATVLTDATIAAIAESYPHDGSTWVPFADHVSLVSCLRATRSALLKVSAQDVTFETAGLWEELLSRANRLLNTSGAIPQHQHSPRERRAQAHLAAALKVANTRIVSACCFPPTRQCLERGLFDTLSQSIPSLVTPPVSSDDVLCVYRPTEHPLEARPEVFALRFYLRQQTIHTSTVTAVVVIPRWLAAAVNIPEVNTDIDIHTLHTAVRFTLSSYCAEVPSPDVLESVLKLWCPLKGDLYHDLRVAVAAATRLA